MVCKTIFTERPRDRKGSHGFTLAEYVITLGISGFLLVAITSFALYNGRGFAAMLTYSDLDRDNKYTMDQMVQDLRGVLSVTAFSTNAVTMVAADGQTLSYTYNAVNRTLTRTKGGVQKVLLRECDRFNFNMEQRNLVAKTFDFYSTTNTSECKAITANWSCSRTILGKKTMETPQLVRVVIRN